MTCFRFHDNFTWFYVQIFSRPHLLSIFYHFERKYKNDNILMIMNEMRQTFWDFSKMTWYDSRDRYDVQNVFFNLRIYTENNGMKTDTSNTAELISLRINRHTSCSFVQIIYDWKIKARKWNVTMKSFLILLILFSALKWFSYWWTMVISISKLL